MSDSAELIVREEYHESKIMLTKMRSNPAQQVAWSATLKAQIMFLCVTTIAYSDSVSFVKHESSMDVSINGKNFATYVWEDQLIPRPHFKQVTAPNGIQVTRRYPTDPVVNKDNDDHATYHPGIWLAFGDINGFDFWRNSARVRHLEFVVEPEVNENMGHFTVRNVYESDDTVVCYETCRYEIRSTPHGYLLSSYSSFEMAEGEFAFGDQEEMGMGIRMATALTVRHGSGAIGNSRDGKNEKGTWGKPAEWCFYEGVVEEQRTGALVIPHRTNFRSSWFHSRDYGLLVANPFGRKAMTAARDKKASPDSTKVPKGEPFMLGFSILLYGSDASEVYNHSAAYEDITEQWIQGIRK